MRAPRFILMLAIAPMGLRAQDSCGEREPPPGPLVSAEWLKHHQADRGIVLLNAERNRATFDSAHIKGARFIAVADFTTKQGQILTELPPVERLDSMLESLGIGNSGRIILYGETLPVTRLYFTLDYLGLGDRVSIVDGGLKGWVDAGGGVTADPTAPWARAELSVTPRPEVLADAGWVDTHRKDPGVVVLDVRTTEEFDGTKSEDGVARPGHIPGAVNLDWTTTIAGGKFKEGAELKQLLGGVGITPGKEIVAYCRVGTRASALYFIGRLLGYKIRLYDGSMNEWSSRVELPVVTGRP